AGFFGRTKPRVFPPPQPTPGGHQLPQRAHGAAVGRHCLPAPRGLAGPDLHLHPGNGRPPDGSDLCRLLRLQRHHCGPAPLLLARAGRRGGREEAGIEGTPPRSLTAACPGVPVGGVGAAPCPALPSEPYRVGAGPPSGNTGAP
uniref:Uncharacterized protein n=1 Tax=Chrysemys picta bellii TaxID=8478 RepID=A0A8C3FAP0_CHRPI